MKNILPILIGVGLGIASSGMTDGTLIGGRRAFMA
jgi:hypothetical protein